ncbi:MULTISPECIES: MHYT domain-containing protein [Citrobacter]|uniref:MHYT domain-containing protein n=1 Tax=Citrobacter TaxID=544 RepID=UPI0032C473BB
MLYVSWDPVLIGISFLVAFIAAFVSLDSAGKVAISVRRESTFWRLSGGITLGMGIWSMHFIAILAMKMGCGVQPIPAQQIPALLQRDCRLKQLNAVSCLPL